MDLLIGFLFGMAFGVTLVAVFAVNSYERGVRDGERVRLHSRDPRP